MPITRGWRTLLIAYVLIYGVLTPGLREILHNSNAPMSGWRTLAGIVQQLLIFAPIFFYRREWGWLHPLIFPTAFDLGKDLLKSPGQLLAPLGIFNGPVRESLTHPRLPEYSEWVMSQATLEYTLLIIVSLLLYYVGFFFEYRYRLFSTRFSGLRFEQARYIAPVALVAASFSMVVALVYIQQHGGLNAYLLSSWGKDGTRGETGGGVFFLVKFGFIACLCWYALKEKAVWNPLFWGAVALTVPVNFFLRGSRSSVFAVLLFFLLIWMIRQQKVPKGRLIGAAFLVLVLVGIMGDFRRSAWEGEMNWNVFENVSVSQAIEETNEEFALRSSLGGGAPIMARVPEEVPYLKGKSYLGAFLFFIPSAIWEDKPSGGGKLNGEIILKRGEGGGGVPPGTVAEAYWNFAVPGVIVIFFLFGMFHRWLAQVFRRYAEAPAVWVPYLFALFRLEPSANQMNNGFKAIVVVVVILVAMGAVRFRKR